jgi:hypothetical protein
MCASKSFLDGRRESAGGCGIVSGGRFAEMRFTRRATASFAFCSRGLRDVASIAACSSFSPARLYRAADLDRGPPNHSRLIAGAFIFLPAENQRPQATRIDSQGIAHILERERSLCLVMENPEPRFPEFLSPTRTFRLEIPLKSSYRVGKDTAHQAHDWFDCSRAPPRRIELCGHNGIGAKFIACRNYRRIDFCNCIVHD